MCPPPLAASAHRSTGSLIASLTGGGLWLRASKRLNTTGSAAEGGKHDDARWVAPVYGYGVVLESDCPRRPEFASRMSLEGDITSLFLRTALIELLCPAAMIDGNLRNRLHAIRFARSPVRRADAEDRRKGKAVPRGPWHFGRTFCPALLSQGLPLAVYLAQHLPPRGV
jgi:hypothetical protein